MKKEILFVTLQGKFRPKVSDFANMYVKNEYYADGDAPEKSVDIQIAIKLKKKIKPLELKSMFTRIHIVGEQTNLFFIILLTLGLFVTKKRH